MPVWGWRLLLLLFFGHLLVLLGDLLHPLLDLVGLLDSLYLLPFGNRRIEA